MSERQRFWILIGVALLLAIAPFLFGWIIRPTGFTLFGNSILNATDPAVYYSYIEQGRDGSLMMRDTFTTENYAATLFQPLWWLVGQLAKIVGLTTVWAYFLIRWLGLVVFGLTWWWAIQWLMKDRAERFFALLLGLFGGGIGGLLILARAWPILSHTSSPDLWVGEAFVFLSALTSGHFLLVSAGLVFVFVSIERSMEDNNWRRIPWVGLVALLTLSIHPFHIITWLLLGTLVLVRRLLQNHQAARQYFARCMAVVAIASPALLLFGLQRILDPLTIDRAVQNTSPSPDTWMMLSGLGIVAPLAMLGAWRMRRVESRRWWIGAWAAAVVVAMYLPLTFQRRLSHAIILPFALLVAPVLARWWKRGNGSRWLAGIVVGLACSSAILIVPYVAKGFVTEREQGPLRMLYLSSEYRSLVDWAKIHISPQEGILASIMNSNVIAGLSARNVYIGHGVETVHFKQKEKALRLFFSQWSKAEQQSFLETNTLCYILDGPRERGYGRQFQPATWNNLEAVWVGPTMSLYKRTDCP